MDSYFEYVDVNSKDWFSKALKSLSINGVVNLRGLVKESRIDLINKKVNKILSNPSYLGGVGFYQKDSFKKTFDGFLLGKEVVETISDERTIDLIKKYLSGDISLKEVFLKNDLGYNYQYFPYHKHTGSDVEGNLNKPFGCAAILYLHDTDEGAFCFALKSHLLKIKKGENGFLSKRNDKEVIKKNLKKIVGKKGDVIIFNETGFHGPEQPVKTPRSVILFGYQLKSYTKNRSRTGIPIIISDMQNLSNKQLDAIGLGGGTREEYEKYHLRAPGNITKKFETIKSFINTVIYFDLKLTIFKNFIKKILRK